MSMALVIDNIRSVNDLMYAATQAVTVADFREVIACAIDMVEDRADDLVKLRTTPKDPPLIETFWVPAHGYITDAYVFYLETQDHTRLAKVSRANNTFALPGHLDVTIITPELQLVLVSDGAPWDDIKAALDKLHPGYEIRNPNIPPMTEQDRRDRHRANR